MRTRTIMILLLIGAFIVFLPVTSAHIVTGLESFFRTTFAGLHLH